MWSRSPDWMAFRDQAAGNRNSMQPGQGAWGPATWGKWLRSSQELLLWGSLESSLCPGLDGCECPLGVESDYLQPPGAGQAVG